MANFDNLDGQEILIGTLEADILDATLALTPTVLAGEGGNDTYRVKGAIDLVVEEAAGGTDTIYTEGDYTLGANIENLILNSAFGAWLTGNDLANRLTGGISADTLDGGAGADVMSGGDGDDTYIVDSLTDVVIELASEGTDLVVASVSHTLRAEVDNLQLVGTGNLAGTGNAGNNTITGNAANNTLNGLAGDDILHGGAGNDILYGGAGINYLYGEDGNDTLVGGNGIDVIDGGSGSDSMSGGYGDDTYYVDADDKPVVEAAVVGNDKVLASASYILPVNVEDLILQGTAVSGTGNAAVNNITGNDEDNELKGLGGNDVLDGGNGADQMYGGLGDDVYYVDDAGDVVVEYLNQGKDRVAVMASLDYGLTAEVEDLTLLMGVVGSGNALANEIEGNGADNVLSGFGGDDTIRGDNGADTLRGGDGADMLDGQAGADTMEGGAGDDTFIVSDVGDVVTENADEGTDVVIASIDYTLGADLEVLQLDGTPLDNLSGTGNVLDNTLYGDGGNNILNGAAGADRMEGRAGNDTYVVDDAADAVIEAAGAGIDLVQSEISYVLGANLENLTLLTLAVNGTGNTLANTITGNTNDNTLNGGAGDDKLYGMAGIDTLIGGLGNDILNGGSDGDVMQGGTGNDKYYVDDALDVVTEAALSGTDEVLSTVAFDLSTAGANIENLTLIGTADVNGTGNAFANVLVGNSGDNVLRGGLGNDSLSGASGTDELRGEAGNDVYYVIDLNDTVIENLDEGLDTVKTILTRGPLEANVENLVLLGSTNIDGTGNLANNVITGSDGNNVLDGAGGVDRLVGGKGDDTFMVDTTTDVLVELLNQGADTILFGATTAGARLIMSANIENLQMTTVGVALNATGNASDNTITGNDAVNSMDGGAGNDALLGGDGDDTLIGNLGNDSLTGGVGNDLLQGGAGNDTYLMVDAGDTVSEAAGAGIDEVRTDVDGYSLAVASRVNVENLVLLGTAVTGTGNALANVITGNGENNVLDGGAGNDTLDGGAGDDTLIGGAGNDTYVVDSAADVVQETLAGAAGGVDTVKTALTIDLGALPNVEHVVLSGAGDVNATGNASANTLTGNDGDNVLTGLAGNDILKGGAGIDVLHGGAGIDTMQGGLDDDTYVVDSLYDVVTELANQGIDLVQTTVSRTLGLNFENLELLGTSNINGTGNTLNNTLTGNSGVNTLSGGDGNDVLDGQGGADRLLGGLGDDVFVFDAADTQVAGSTGIDTLRFTGSGESLDLTAIANTVYTGLEVFDLAGSGNNSLIADVNDILALSDTSNRLIVDGDAGDAVNLEPSGLTGWTQGADESIGGVLYATYTAGLASVYVDADVGVTLV